MTSQSGTMTLIESWQIEKTELSGIGQQILDYVADASNDIKEQIVNSVKNAAYILIESKGFNI